MKKAIFFCLVLFCSITVFGQNMSLPSAAYYEYLLQSNGCGAADGIDVPDLIFKAACDQHDIDYGILGRPKLVSDQRFLRAMTKACVDTFGQNQTLLTGCLDIAQVYFIAVTVGGIGAYNRAQALARNLQAAKERERGMCYLSDVFVQQSGNTYFVAIDW
ncbi:MAG: hypothetical protein LBQ94_02060 [Treponema sp.]|jgi:hypothetical protein|nr:hypothetical protein [Treponema sp.]